jgi:hypothetical protein
MTEILYDQAGNSLARFKVRSLWVRSSQLAAKVCGYFQTLQQTKGK